MSQPDEESEQNQYDLREVVGRGGMATVYRAYDELARQEVALKVLHAHFVGDEGIVEAFEREARLMDDIDHPAVVRVYETTEVDGRPAIAMELCDGDDLADLLARRGPFDEKRALEVIGEILDALSAVHDLDVLHRDVKPHNIVFDAEGNPKLIDFGIGQAEELMAMDDAGQVGTVEYMAPERTDGFAVDARSDLYSAGVVLFEMLCGHPPYRAESASAVLRMHREAPVADPRTFDADVSDEVAEALMVAMAKHPEERFDDIERFADALDGSGRNREPIGEHPVWRALQRRHGDDCQMSAPVETSGHEWVVYIPEEVVDNNAGRSADAVQQLVDKHDEHVSHDFRDMIETAQARRRVRRSITHKEISRDEVAGQVLAHYGVARGLSRDGVDDIVGELEEAGIMARYGRRPRRSRDDSWIRGIISRTRVWKSAAWSVCFGIYAVLGYFGYLGIEAGAAAALPVTFVVGMLAVVSVTSGVGLATMLLPDTFGEWWQSRISTNYLLDFCRNRRLEHAGQLVGRREYELLKSLQSPRIAASYERAVNMVLHLRGLGVGEGRLGDVVDGLGTLVDELVDLESHLAAVHPGRIVSRLHQLDRRLEDEDEIERLERLMDEKSRLRKRLTKRDAAHQRLQALAQRMHEISVRLETLVRRYRTDRVDGDLPDDAVEIGALTSDIEEMTILDFSPLDAGEETTRRDRPGDRSRLDEPADQIPGRVAKSTTSSTSPGIASS